MQQIWMFVPDMQHLHRLSRICNTSAETSHICKKLAVETQLPVKFSFYSETTAACFSANFFAAASLL